MPLYRTDFIYPLKYIVTNSFNIYSIIAEPRKENPKGRNKEEEEKD